MTKQDYNRYIRMQSVPAGAILNHLINHQQKNKSEIARQSNLIPQRLNDLINGTRRFTVKTSLQLEKTLEIKFKGFFYIHQAQHDIYVAEKNKKVQLPNISVLTQTTFWDTKIEELDFDKSYKFVISRVLEYGNDDEFNTIVDFYGKNKVMEVAEEKKLFRIYDLVEKRKNEIAL